VTRLGNVFAFTGSQLMPEINDLQWQVVDRDIEVGGQVESQQIESRLCSLQGVSTFVRTARNHFEHGCQAFASDPFR